VTAIALAPEPTTPGSSRRFNPPSPPSFEIRGAVGVSLSAPRWDRINSAAVIAVARGIYFAYLQTSGGGIEPCGIVISGPAAEQGRVVFDTPVLLPGEQYLPIDLVRTRAAGRTRSPRPFSRG